MINKKKKPLKYYNENIEFGVVRGDCHRRQIAGRSSRNNRSFAAGQHQDMGAHRRQGGNCSQYRQLLQARQSKHEAVRPRQKQL